jgi:hypothetical protein
MECELMNPVDCPMMILYDPMAHVQEAPLVVETQDFKCTIEYKLAGDMLDHDLGAGNL